MVAIREVTDFKAWEPQTESVLDLRLGIFTDEERENSLICQKSAEMGVRLKELYTQASYISLEGYAGLVEHCPNLEILNLCCAYKTGDAALKVISRLSSLKELNLQLARNESCIESLGPITRCSDLDSVEEITDAGMEAILMRCEQLRAIDLSGTRITDRTLCLIASKPNVAVLRVNNCWNLTKEAIAQLRAARPDMSILDEGGADPTSSFMKLRTEVASRYYSTEVVVNPSTVPVLTSERERDLICPTVFLN